MKKFSVLSLVLSSLALSILFLSTTTLSGETTGCNGQTIYATLIGDVHTSTLPSNYFNNRKLDLNGTLHVDNTTAMTGCTIFAISSTSKIVVENGSTLGTKSCVFQGCNDTWKGIEVASNCKAVIRGSTIQNADVGLLLHANSKVSDVQYSYFLDNEVALQVGETSCCGAPMVSPFISNTFSTLPSGAVQTPKVGLQLYYVSNAFIAAYSNNTFENIPIGIKSFGTQLTIRDGTFSANRKASGLVLILRTQNSLTSDDKYKKVKK